MGVLCKDAHCRYRRLKAYAFGRLQARFDQRDDQGGDAQLEPQGQFGAQALAADNVTALIAFSTERFVFCMEDTAVMGAVL